MRTTVKVVYENGVFKPTESVYLPEHAEGQVVISSPPKLDPDDPTGWKAIERLIGAGKATIPNVAESHDDYL